MLRLTRSWSHGRAAWAVLLAVALALRLVTPPGFMPAFDHGRLAIVDCPGSAPGTMATMPGMGHGKGKGDSNCPFAAATGAGVAAVPAALPLESVFEPARAVGKLNVAAPHPLGEHERPPPIGPPIPV